VRRLPESFWASSSRSVALLMLSVAEAAGGSWVLDVCAWRARSRLGYVECCFERLGTDGLRLARLGVCRLRFCCRGRADGLEGDYGRNWLRLTEDEGQRLVLPRALWHADSAANRLCLVGRLLSSKVPRFEAFCTSLQGMINSVKGMDICQIGGGRFLLRFNHVIDRNRALEACPWSFEKNVIILSGIGEKENPLRVDLDWCKFHVHMHELPLSMMNLGVATLIGNRIGRFRDMDMDDTGCAWGATLHLGVAVNRLPNFCYFCGNLGHIAKYYELQFEEGFVDPGSDSPYGPWLRALLPIRGRGQPSRHDPSVASKPDKNPGTSQPRGAAIFGNFAGQAWSVSTEQGDTAAVRCDGFRADSIESFSPSRLGRQGRAQSDEGVAPVTSVHDEQGLEDTGDGVPVIPTVGGEHVLEAEKGADTSAEFVPSTIPEFELRAAVWAKDRMMARLEGDLITVPLRFIAKGQPSRRGSGRWGRPRGSGRTGSLKRQQRCSV
ncbi:hypothetical protein Salat_1166300, partial [Sesamum alatum]